MGGIPPLATEFNLRLGIGKPFFVSAVFASLSSLLLLSSLSWELSLLSMPERSVPFVWCLSPEETTSVEPLPNAVVPSLVSAAESFRPGMVNFVRCGLGRGCV